MQWEGTGRQKWRSRTTTEMWNICPESHRIHHGIVYDWRGINFHSKIPTAYIMVSCDYFLSPCFSFHGKQPRHAASLSGRSHKARLLTHIEKAAWRGKFWAGKKMCRDLPALFPRRHSQPKLLGVKIKNGQNNNKTPHNVIWTQETWKW